MLTLPESLKSLGYHTHSIGKWHLGAAHKRDTPTGKGFDSHFGYWNGFIGYFDYEISEEVLNKTKVCYFSFTMVFHLNIY